MIWIKKNDRKKNKNKSLIYFTSLKYIQFKKLQNLYFVNKWFNWKTIRLQTKYNLTIVLL